MKRGKKRQFSQNVNHPMWVDYRHKLTEEEKEFLYRFGAEFYLGKFTDNPLHSEAAKKELLNNRNAARRDVLAACPGCVQGITPRRGRYSERDYLREHGGERSPEDALIEYLDKAGS